MELLDATIALAMTLAALATASAKIVATRKRLTPRGGT
jgi:hypothetical protein